jgi:hypothetical protein
MADQDQRTRLRNIGGGVVFKVRLTQDSFGAKFGAITKAGPLEADPSTK